MTRIDKQDQQEFEPQRMIYAIDKVEALGYEIVSRDTTTIQFIFKEQLITFYPYSGAATGESINDCRGLAKLIIQLKNKL
tara:strand:- start:691 stop:930 length:240 start_codon:yes stop_codon:yes gene_type:complete